MKLFFFGHGEAIMILQKDMCTSVNTVLKYEMLYYIKRYTSIYMCIYAYAKHSYTCMNVCINTYAYTYVHTHMKGF